jgi:hypothetical protein
MRLFKAMVNMPLMNYSMCLPLATGITGQRNQMQATRLSRKPSRPLSSKVIPCLPYLSRMMKLKNTKAQAQHLA